MSNSLPLNYHIVSRHIIHLDLETLKGFSDKVKYQRIVRLLKSKFYAIRKATYIGQNIPDEADNEAFIF